MYLKRFAELSSGQQYRACLAKLVDGGANVWLADEFCANLDVLTAQIVALRLQAVARQLGAVLVVAASQPASFVSALRPDTVVQLTSSTEFQVLSGSAFLRKLNFKPETWTVPRLPLAAHYLPAVRSGRKQSTVRKGRLYLAPGPVMLQFGATEVCVQVTGTKQCRACELTSADAIVDGFDVDGFSVGYFVGQGGSPNEIADPQKLRFPSAEYEASWAKACDSRERQEWKRVIS